MLFELFRLTSESEISPVSGSVCFCVNFASMVILEGAQGESSRILLASAAVHWFAGLSQGPLAGNANATSEARTKLDMRAVRGIGLPAAMPTSLGRLQVLVVVAPIHKRFLPNHFCGGLSGANGSLVGTNSMGTSVTKVFSHFAHSSMPNCSEGTWLKMMSALWRPSAM